MKEMTFLGYGIVWDPEKDQEVCRFVDGEIKTSDPYILRWLKGVYPEKKKRSTK